ncbi:MAG: ArsR family transcriptional regulator [Naasia sp.]|nr:ArsR family transcriptional regulator [Naasia sp.]
MADIFDVVADPTRRDLLRILLERSVEGASAPHGGESSVGELVTRLGLSQPTVSKHLKVLRDSGLVSVRDQGQHRFYRLDVRPLGAVASWLDPFVAPMRAPEAVESPVEQGVPASRGLGAGPRSVASRLGAAAAASVHGVRSAAARGRR